MNFLLKMINKILFFESVPQKIGLSQIKDDVPDKKTSPSIKNKDVKLSDLMRRVS